MVNDGNTSHAAEPTGDEHLGGRRGGAEDIGAQTKASDLLIGDVLESRPPLRVEQGLVFEPIGHGLLGDSRAIQVAAQSVGKSGLTAGNVDSALERGNVRFIHGGISYTSMLVKVNKRTRVTEHKVPCKVIQMPARQQKLAATVSKPNRKKSGKRVRQTPLAVGPDGKTANQRLNSVMNRESIPQADLVRRCNQAAGRAADAEPPVVSQAVLSNFQRNLDDLANSSYVTIIAETIGVRGMWLQYGIGPEKDDRTITDEAREWAKKLLARP